MVGYCLTWSRRVKVATRKEQSPCLAGAPFASEIEKTLLTLNEMQRCQMHPIRPVQISPLRPHSVRCPICSPRNFPLHCLEISFFGCGTSRIEQRKEIGLCTKKEDQGRDCGALCHRSDQITFHERIDWSGYRTLHLSRFFGFMHG